MIKKFKIKISILLMMLMVTTIVINSTAYAVEKKSSGILPNSTTVYNDKTSSTGIIQYVYDSVHNIYIGVGNYKAVGNYGTYYFGAVYTSSDGKTWKKGNCPSSYNLYSIATDGNGTVVIGGGYDGKYGIETHVYTTSDGSSTWKETIKGYSSKMASYKSGNFIGIVKSVTYANGKFTVVGKNYNTKYVKSSLDGYIWN